MKEKIKMFNELVKKYFVFLEQYGYIYEEANSTNCMNFIGKNNDIIIIFSENEYELSCQFQNKENNIFTLQDALKYTDINEFKGLYQLPNKEEIEKGIIYLAEVLKILLVKIDISNNINFNKILQYKMDKCKTQLKDYYCKVDLNKAEEYWIQGDYLNAKSMYEKHINDLSKAQIKKLDYIKKRLKSL